MPDDDRWTGVLAGAAFTLLVGLPLTLALIACVVLLVLSAFGLYTIPAS